MEGTGYVITGKIPGGSICLLRKLWIWRPAGLQDLAKTAEKKHEDVKVMKEKSPSVEDRVPVRQQK